MQIINILIALLPALFWGSLVLINVFVGGGPYNQIRGTTLGTLVIGLILLLTGHAQFDNPTVIIVGLISVQCGHSVKELNYNLLTLSAYLKQCLFLLVYN